MVTKTSALLSNEPLRRRIQPFTNGTPTMHTLTLNTASGSVTSSDSAKDFTVVYDNEDENAGDETKLDGLSSGDETGSDLGAGDDDDDALKKPSETKQRKENSSLPPLDTKNLPEYADHARSPDSPNTRAWYEFDLAVVVALVSPIGNWLTGGDHIKNLFLIILLIFYLHQIIEVPWELYRKARPRRRAPNIPPSKVDEKYKQIATSELHALELFFLALTAASPFFGALFLRYATAAVLGEDSVSWFSTALFVMATGMRPWSHLVERFNRRTTDLHDVIHYPSPNINAEDVQAQMADMLKRIAYLERSLAKTKTKFVDATEEVYEYVDHAVDSVDRSVRKHDKKYDKQDAKIKDLEHTIEMLKGKGKQKVGLSVNTQPASPSLLNYILPQWWFSPPPHHRTMYTSPTYSPSGKASLRSFPSSSSMQLETIPEEETSKYPVLAQPANLPALVLSRIGYLATMPLRAVLRMVLRNY
ncbi:hypothetical protein Hypma_000549 [Hypsizygus marmoreus]|uniref:Uncharacterized protein n=1 Tax=Hypsizygus marmoreus TaxID=39966 RepID=A0A369JAD0_HYPMA|nr:hypothetical protein Hypma_000549 [Hypsizygus marmoreus]